MDMEESKKQFKLVYDSDNHTYTIWVQDDQGLWLRKKVLLLNAKKTVHGKAVIAIMK